MGKRAKLAPIPCAGVLAIACTQGRRWQHGKPDSVVGDKKALFEEILRVLKPGGVFAASDWLAGVNAESSLEWKQFRELAHLTFNFATASEIEEVMREAGFEMVSSVDRNAWYKQLTVEEVQGLEGPLKERIVEVSDEDTYNHWLKVRRTLRDSVAAGALRPTHLRGLKYEI